MKQNLEENKDDPKSLMERIAKKDMLSII